MRSVVVCGLISLLGAEVATAQNKEGPRQPKKEIRLARSVDDWMYIYDDGAGTVGFGAGGSYQVFFKAGTFDFDKVEKELRALKTVEKGDAEAHYGFSFSADEKKGDKNPPGFATADRKYISGLFQKGIESHHHAGDKLDRWGPFLLGRVALVRMADTWVVESAEHDGKPVAGLKGLKVTVGSPRDEKKLTETVGGKARSAELRIATSFFSTADQFELLTHVGEPFKTKRVTIYGVYALDGDKLQIRRSGNSETVMGVNWDAKAEQPDGKQPKALDAKDGVLLVLKRETK